MITSSAEFGVDCDPAEYESVAPMTLLRHWLPPQEHAPALMALATQAADGYPRVRHVLLSEADDTAVYFHTDARSGKVAELEDRPRAGIALAWPTVGRQIVAHGDVRRVSADRAGRTYARRSRYLQLLAWLNDQESADSSPQQRHRRWSEFDVAHPALDPPSTWAGFAVELREVTFWRGDPEGPSRRVRFRRDAQSRWDSAALPG